MSDTKHIVHLLDKDDKKWKRNYIRLGPDSVLDSSGKTFFQYSDIAAIVLGKGTAALKYDEHASRGSHEYFFSIKKLDGKTTNIGTMSGEQRKQIIFDLMDNIGSSTPEALSAIKSQINKLGKEQTFSIQLQSVQEPAVSHSGSSSVRSSIDKVNLNKPAIDRKPAIDTSWKQRMPSSSAIKPKTKSLNQINGGSLSLNDLLAMAETQNSSESVPNSTTKTPSKPMNMNMWRGERGEQWNQKMKDLMVIHQGSRQGAHQRPDQRKERKPNPPKVTKPTDGKWKRIEQMERTMQERLDELSDKRSQIIQNGNGESQAKHVGGTKKVSQTEEAIRKYIMSNMTEKSEPSTRKSGENDLPSSASLTAMDHLLQEADNDLHRLIISIDQRLNANGEDKATRETSDQAKSLRAIAETVRYLVGTLRS